MSERLTDEQLDWRAHSPTVRIAADELLALRARVAKLKSLLEECAENFEMWHDAKNILAKIDAALEDAPQ